MDKTAFFEAVVKELNERGYVTETKEIEKNGRNCFAVVVGSGEVRPTAYLDGYYEGGASVTECVDRITEQIDRAIEDAPQFCDYASYFNVDEVLKRVRIFVSRAGTYKDYLRKEENGITLTLAVIIGSTPEDAFGSIRVKEEHLKHWGLEEEDLWKVARANAENNVVIKGMGETIVEMCGEERAERLGMSVKREEDEMLIVSSPNKANGAYAAFTDKVKEYISDTFHTDKYIILPSSIHECIIIPYSSRAINKNNTDEENLKEFEYMVKSVNATQVAEEDQLADTPLLMAI